MKAVAKRASDHHQIPLPGGQTALLNLKLTRPGGDIGHFEQVPPPNAGVPTRAH
jgi:hypothetical protein